VIELKAGTVLRSDKETKSDEANVKSDSHEAKKQKTNN